MEEDELAEVLDHVFFTMRWKVKSSPPASCGRGTGRA